MISVDFLESLLKNAPSSHTAFLILSKMKEEGYTENFEQRCIDALRIFPDDIRIRALLSRHYMDTGQIHEALSEIGKASFLLDDHAYIYKLEAEIKRKAGMEREAALSFKKYLAIHPGASNRDDVEEKGDITEAPREDYATEGDVLPLVSPTIAELYLKQGMVGEAIDAYKKIVEENPDDQSSKRRLEELLSLGQVSEDKVGTGNRAKTERLIHVLERWLTGIQEMTHA